MHDDEGSSFYPPLCHRRRLVTHGGKPFDLFSDQGTNFNDGELGLQDMLASLHPGSNLLSPSGRLHFSGCKDTSNLDLFVDGSTRHLSTPDVYCLLSNGPFGLSSVNLELNPELQVLPCFFIIDQPNWDSKCQLKAHSTSLHQNCSEASAYLINLF